VPLTDAQIAWATGNRQAVSVADVIRYLQAEGDVILGVRDDPGQRQMENRSMYEIFDSFLLGRNWSRQHDNDLEQFYLRLSKVVRHSDFNPDQMGEYFRQRTASTPREAHPFRIAIDRYVADAWAIRKYLSVMDKYSGVALQL
jgi:hypothetical protein